MTSNGKTPAIGKIPVWIRMVLATASIGSGVIGYFAIMRADTPEVGGVAFVALAGLFGVLAAIGRVPQKVNAGSMGVEFAEVETLVDAAEQIPASNRVLFAEKLQRNSNLSATYRVASDLILAGADFERLVIDLLAAADLLDGNSSATWWAGSGIDAVIVVRGRRFAVSIKASRHSAVLEDEAEKMTAAAAALDLDGAVVIVPDAISTPQAWFYFGGVLVIPASKVRNLRDLLGDVQ